MFKIWLPTTETKKVTIFVGARGNNPLNTLSTIFKLCIILRPSMIGSRSNSVSLGVLKITSITIAGTSGITIFLLDPYLCPTNLIPLSAHLLDTMSDKNTNVISK